MQHSNQTPTHHTRNPETAAAPLSPHQARTQLSKWLTSTLLAPHLPPPTLPARTHHNHQAHARAARTPRRHEAGRPYTRSAAGPTGHREVCTASRLPDRGACFRDPPSRAPSGVACFRELPSCAPSGAACFREPPPVRALGGGVLSRPPLVRALGGGVLSRAPLVVALGGGVLSPAPPRGGPRGRRTFASPPRGRKTRVWAATRHTFTYKNTYK